MPSGAARKGEKQDEVKQAPLPSVLHADHRDMIVPLTYIS